VATIEISCVEIWRELSNSIDDDAEPALRPPGFSERLKAGLARKLGG